MASQSPNQHTLSLHIALQTIIKKYILIAFLIILSFHATLRKKVRALAQHTQIRVSERYFSRLHNSKPRFLQGKGMKHRRDLIESMRLNLVHREQQCMQISLRYSCHMASVNLKSVLTFFSKFQSLKRATKPFKTFVFQVHMSKLCPF